MHFNTRTHAGKLLAKTLAKFLTKKYPDMDAVIYALPRGGVPLGFEIALALDMPLDLIIPRKIGYPLNPEYAIGAVTENGDTVRNEVELAKLDPDWFEQELKEEMAEAKRRR
jgi:putative phosphoribosyl transferase